MVKQRMNGSLYQFIKYTPMEISIQILFLILSTLITIAGFLILLFSHLERKQKQKRKNFLQA